MTTVQIGNAKNQFRSSTKKKLHDNKLGRLRKEQYRARLSQMGVSDMQIHKDKKKGVEKLKSKLHDNELARIRMQKYRGKKRMEKLNLLENAPFAESSSVNAPLPTRRNTIHTSQVAGPSWLEVPLMPTHTANPINIPFVAPSTTLNTIHTSQVAGPSWLDTPFIPTRTVNAIDVPFFCINEEREINSEFNENNVSQLNENLSHLSESESHTQNTENALESTQELQNFCDNIRSRKHSSIAIVQPQNSTSRRSGTHATYSNYSEHSSAHLEFKKQFFDNDFGYACDICDRLWFKNHLKTFQNSDETANI